MSASAVISSTAIHSGFIVRSSSSMPAGLRCTGQHVRACAEAELRHAGGTGRQLQPLVHNADAPAEPVGELPDEVAQQRRLAAARRAAQEHGLWPRPERITQAVGNAVRLAGDAQVQGRRLAQGCDRAVLHDGRSADAEAVSAGSVTKPQRVISCMA